MIQLSTTFDSDAYPDLVNLRANQWVTINAKLAPSKDLRRIHLKEPSIITP
ncbi:MAG: hypothetical protein HKN23_10730 [Verrucomicrobiales bacterium]|nr:hypothetical protein [Verrucomicrobiales bacterium]